MQHLKKQQCFLEGVIGSLKKTAIIHAEVDPTDPKVEKLFRLALEAKALRDPQVVEFYEQRRMKRLQAGAVS